MIVESPSAIRLIAALSENGPMGATREHLSHLADISTTTFYRLIGPLIENALVRTSGARYSLAMEQAYCFRFKLWHDMERLYRLSPQDRDTVLSTAAAIRANDAGELRALWLVGSGARGELRDASDLDFLVVTVQPTKPIAAGVHARQVSIVQMSEDEFRDAYSTADSFVVSAIQDGIVLIDNDFAQPFYLAPPPVQIGSRSVREGKVLGDAYRAQLIDQIALGDVEQARSLLRTQAIHTGRLVLRPFGILPANRRELVEVSRIFFGDAWADTLATAILFSPSTKDELILVSRLIAEHRDRVEGQTDHLQRFAPLPTAHGLSLERLGAEVFKELVPFVEVSRGAWSIDLRIADKNNVVYLVEFKSSTGSLSDNTIQRTLERIDRARSKTEDGRKVQTLLVANPQSDTTSAPAALSNVLAVSTLMRDRDAMYSMILERSPESDLAVVTGLHLLRAHNRFHLDHSDESDAVIESLLEEGRRLRLRIREWTPHSPKGGTTFDIKGEGGPSRSEVFVFTFPEGQPDGWIHRSSEATGERTWAVRGVGVSKVEKRRAYAVALPPSLAKRVKSWDKRWPRIAMSRDVTSSADLRQNLEDRLGGDLEALRIEVSDAAEISISH